MDRGDERGLREVEKVGVAAHVARVLREALAPVLLFREAALVDEHAPRPVEDEDPLGEKLFQVFACVLHAAPSKCNDSRLRGREPGRLSGSLGVW